MASQLVDARFAHPRSPRPHVGKDPHQVRHGEAWTATGSRAPRRVYPGTTAVDVPRGWRCLYTCLHSYNPPEAVRVYRNNQSGMRAINLFDWGESSSLKPTFFPHIILAFGFGLWLLPLNFPVESWDGRFVWNPKFSFRFSNLGRLAFLLRVLSG